MDVDAILTRGPRSHLGMERLLTALADAPDVPEGDIDRVSNNGTGTVPAYRALRWDGDESHPLRYKAQLTETQLGALQDLADGKHQNHLRGPNYNRNGVLRGGMIRLGASHIPHAMAIAVHLGLVHPRNQRYVLGPAFRVHGSVRRDDPVYHDITLTKRKVLVGIANGMSDQEIADEMAVGKETVKTHVKDLLAAYGARNRAHLAALAVRHKHLR